MAVPIAVVGCFLLWKEADSARWVLMVAGLFVLLAFLAPAALRPVEHIWMKIAKVMGWFMTRAILIVAFYLVFFPFGLVLRLMGKDLLQFRVDKSQQSYWEPTEVDGPQTRPDKPY